MGFTDAKCQAILRKISKFENTDTVDFEDAANQELIIKLRSPKF